jgi:hypothetical protein
VITRGGEDVLKRSVARYLAAIGETE